MNVVIRARWYSLYENGSFYLRHFKSGYEASSYEASEKWHDQWVSVPDHVVVAYSALYAQVSTMNTLLMTYDRESFERRLRTV